MILPKVRIVVTWNGKEEVVVRGDAEDNRVLAKVRLLAHRGVCFIIIIH